MNQDYIYHSFTRTFCNECDKLVDGKIVYNSDGVFVFKLCPDCGERRELLEEDAGYHLSKARFDKPGTLSAVQTKTQNGCPYDCGLCKNHDQHTCIGIIEITKRCNLGCSMCYANCGKTGNTGKAVDDSEAENGSDLKLDRIGKMMDFYMEAENGNAEILQISGGEPTLHKDILTIIRMAQDKGFRYVMLNTNGIRLAEDEDFVRALSGFRGGFEVYMQFDGLSDEVYENLRGRKLSDIKKKAISNLAKYNVPATLVATIENGVNDHLCGEILVYGMKQRCVRGVNFQPLGYYHDAPKERVTLSGILNRIEKQTQRMIRAADFMPLPCNVERNALTFLFKDKNGFLPITRDRDLSEFKDAIGNTFMFTVEDTLKSFSDESKIFNVCSCCDIVDDIKKHLPANFILKSKAEKMKFVDENTFRISVSSFVDKYNFDTKSMQKECVHIITPDLSRIPFSAYNMLHRGGTDKYECFYM